MDGTPRLAYTALVLYAAVLFFKPGSLSCV